MYFAEDDTPSGFPMEILECTSLEYVNVFYQGFVSLPPEIGKLQDLKMLNVSHNPNLLSIPAEVGTISSLTSKSIHFIFNSLYNSVFSHY